MWIPGSLHRRLTQFILKRSIGKILNDELEMDQVDLGVIDGYLTLKNLHLNTTVINAALQDIPFELKEGSVGRVSIKVPWRDLLTQSCVIEMAEVTLVFIPSRGTGDGAGPDKSTAAPNNKSSVPFGSDDEANSAHKRDTLDGIAMVAGVVENILSRIKGRLLDVTVYIQSSAVHTPSDPRLCLKIKKVRYEDLSMGIGLKEVQTRDLRIERVEFGLDYQDNLIPIALACVGPDDCWLRIVQDTVDASAPLASAAEPRPQLQPHSRYECVITAVHVVVGPDVISPMLQFLDNCLTVGEALSHGRTSTGNQTRTLIDSNLVESWHDPGGDVRNSEASGRLRNNMLTDLNKSLTAEDYKQMEDMYRSFSESEVTHKRELAHQSIMALRQSEFNALFSRDGTDTDEFEEYDEGASDLGQSVGEKFYDLEDSTHQPRHSPPATVEPMRAQLHISHVSVSVLYDYIPPEKLSDATDRIKNYLEASNSAQKHPWLDIQSHARVHVSGVTLHRNTVDTGVVHDSFSLAEAVVCELLYSETKSPPLSPPTVPKNERRNLGKSDDDFKNKSIVSDEDPYNRSDEPLNGMGTGDSHNPQLGTGAHGLAPKSTEHPLPEIRVETPRTRLGGSILRAIDTDSDDDDAELCFEDPMRISALNEPQLQQSMYFSTQSVACSETTQPTTQLIQTHSETTQLRQTHSHGHGCSGEGVGGGKVETETKTETDKETETGGMTRVGEDAKGDAPIAIQENIRPQTSRLTDTHTGKGGFGAGTPDVADDRPSDTHTGETKRREDTGNDGHGTQDRTGAHTHTPTNTSSVMATDTQGRTSIGAGAGTSADTRSSIHGTEREDTLSRKAKHDNAYSHSNTWLVMEEAHDAHYTDTLRHPQRVRPLLTFGTELRATTQDRIDILWETMFSTERSSASANRRTSSETDTDETTDAHNNPHTHSGERVGQTEHKPTPSGQVPNFPSIVSSSPAVIPCVRASRHTHTYRDKDTNVLPSRHAYKSTPTHTQTDTGTPKSEQACTYTQRNIHLHRYSGDDGVRHTPDNNMGVYDNTTGPYDNQTSAYDNQTSAYDNQACAYNNQTSAYDNQTRAPGERDVDRGSELFYSVRGLDNACSEVLESVALETVTINDTLRVQSVVLDMDPSLPLRIELVAQLLTGHTNTANTAHKQNASHAVDENRTSTVLHIAKVMIPLLHVVLHIPKYTVSVQAYHHTPLAVRVISSVLAYKHSSTATTDALQCTMDFENIEAVIQHSADAQDTDTDTSASRKASQAQIAPQTVTVVCVSNKGVEYVHPRLCAKWNDLRESRTHSSLSSLAEDNAKDAHDNIQFEEEISPFNERRFNAEGEKPPREGANDSDYVAYKQAVCDSSEWQVSVSLPSVDVTMSKRSFDTVSLISERLSVWQAKIARTREHTDIHKGKEASLTSNGQKGQSGPLLDVVVSALNLELSDTSAPSQSSSGHPKDTAAPAQLEFECTQVSLLAIANSLGTCDNIIVLKCSSVCLYETPPIRPTSTAEEAGREAMNKPRGPKNRSSDAENRFMAERLPVILHPRLDDLSKQSGDTKLPPETMLTVTISTTTQATATANGMVVCVDAKQLQLVHRQSDDWAKVLQSILTPPQPPIPGYAPDPVKIDLSVNVMDSDVLYEEPGTSASVSTTVDHINISSVLNPRVPSSAVHISAHGVGLYLANGLALGTTPEITTTRRSLNQSDRLHLFLVEKGYVRMFWIAMVDFGLAIDPTEGQPKLDLQINSLDGRVTLHTDSLGVLNDLATNYMEQQVSAKVSKNMSNDGQATDDRNVSASGPGLAREPDLTQSQALGLTLAVNEDLYTPAHTPYPEKGPTPNCFPNSLMYQARKAFEDLPGAADDRDDDNTDYETSSGHSFEIIGSQTRQILHSMTPAHTEAGEDALDPTIGPELSESDQQPAMPSVDYESSIPGPVQDSSIPSYVPGSSDIEDPAHNNSYERVSITSLLSHVSSSTAQLGSIAPLQTSSQPQTAEENDALTRHAYYIDPTVPMDAPPDMASHCDEDTSNAPPTHVSWSDGRIWILDYHTPSTVPTTPTPSAVDGQMNGDGLSTTTSVAAETETGTSTYGAVHAHAYASVHVPAASTTAHSNRGDKEAQTETVDFSTAVGVEESASVGDESVLQMGSPSCDSGAGGSAQDARLLVEPELLIEPELSIEQPNRKAPVNEAAVRDWIVMDTWFAEEADSSPMPSAKPLPFTHRVVLADVRVSLELREGFAFAQNSSATPTHTLTPTQIHTPAYSSTPAQSQQQRNLVQHTDTHTNTSKSPSLASPPVSTKAPSEGGRVTRSEGTDDKDTKRRTRVSSPTHGHTHRAIHIQSPDVDISRPAEGVARETVAREKLSDEKARSKSSPAASPAPVPRTSTTSKRTSTYLDSGSHEGISSTGTNLENDAYSGIGEEDRPPVYGNSEPITFSAVPVPSPASYESITSADVLGYERAELVSETRRNNNNMVVVKTFNGALDLRIYTPDCPKTFRLVVSSDIEIFDRVATSRWNKVMYYWQREAKPRPDGSSMIRLEVVGFRPVRSTEAETERVRDDGAELRASLYILPLRLNIDQDALELVINFADRLQQQTAKSARTPTPSASTSPPGSFFQKVSIDPLELVLNYKAKRLSLGEVSGGNFSELLNLFSLDASHIKLPACVVTAKTGVPQVADDLLDQYITHVRASQISRIVAGVYPLRALVNVGQGMADLVLMPLDELQRNQSVSNGLRKGTHSFIRNVSLEAMNASTKLLLGANAVFEFLDDVVGSETQPHTLAHLTAEIGSRSSDTRSRTSSLSTEGGQGQGLGHNHLMNSIVFEDIADETTNAHQPSGVTDGFLEGYNSLTREVNRAVTTIVMVPIQEYKRVGTHGAIKSVIRAVPVAVLRPLIGASDAASKAIQGVRSAVDTQRRDDRADKYKRP